MPVSDKPVQVALVDPLSVAGTRPRYAESRGAVAEQTVQEKKNAKKNRWEVSGRALHMRSFEDQNFIKPVKGKVGIDNVPGARQRIRPEFHSGYESHLRYSLPNSNWSVGGNGRFFSMYSHHGDVTRAMPGGGGVSNPNGTITGRQRLNIGYRGNTPGNFDVADGHVFSAQSSTIVSSIDVDAEYTFDSVPQLAAKGGVRIGGIYRKLDVDISAGKQNNGIQRSNILSENTVWFLGVGPTIGTSIDQPIVAGLKGRFDVGASILSGASSVRSHNQLSSEVSRTTYTANFDSLKFHVVPVIDANIALAYEHNIYDVVHGALEIGFTTQHWLGLHDFMREHDGYSHGRLDTTIVGYLGPYFKAKVTW